MYTTAQQASPAAFWQPGFQAYSGVQPAQGGPVVRQVPSPIAPQQQVTPAFSSILTDLMPILSFAMVMGIMIPMMRQMTTGLTGDTR